MEFKAAAATVQVVTFPVRFRFRVRPQRRVHLAVQGGGRLVLGRAL